MSSNLLTTILCPKCGKKLELWWSRNDANQRHIVPIVYMKVRYQI